MTELERQYITDVDGKPIGIILPLEEHALIEEILERSSQLDRESKKRALMEKAVNCRGSH